MAHARIENRLGVHHVYGWRPSTMQAAAELGLEAACHGGIEGGFRSFEGARAYFKGEPLRGRARLRHAVRRSLFGLRLPRVNEYYNLSWLTERLFQTPLPLAAGAFFRGGSAAYQWLLTAEVPGARNLRDVLEQREADRCELLAELAREVARMHALHFVHRDLYPRNVLVGPPELPRRLFFLDAWRGGCSLQLRRAPYDLACLFLEAPGLLEPEEQRALFTLYARERSAQGRPAPDDLARRVERERARLVRRLVRRPELRGGRPLPPLEWRLGDGG